MTIDEIAARAEIDVSRVPADLLALELEGAVRRGADGRYSRIAADWPGRKK